MNNTFIFHVWVCFKKTYIISDLDLGPMTCLATRIIYTLMFISVPSLWDESLSSYWLHEGDWHTDRHVQSIAIFPSFFKGEHTNHYMDFVAAGGHNCLANISGLHIDLENFPSLKNFDRGNNLLTRRDSDFIHLFILIRTFTSYLHFEDWLTS